MRLVGIIPARAGSKRLPGKNLAPLAGLPLIAHTCRAALSAGVCDRVYANTEDAKIANVAAEHGVPAPVLRPPELASDSAPTHAAIAFMLNWLAARGEMFDAVMLLQPTSPLRTGADIRAAWELFLAHQPCSVISVTPLAPHNWLGTVDPHGRFERCAGDALLHRINGAIYLHPVSAYLLNQQLPTHAYSMPPERSVDIDRATDMDYAAFLLERDTQTLAGQRERRP